ncbi:MAG: DMT family transporter [Rhodospirillales bacterium]|nr:DMT family transporter [Rhodospirillales bacterium]
MPTLTHLSPNLRGVLWLLGSSAVFSVMNLTIKALGPSMPTPEVMLFRTFFGLLALAPFILAEPKQALSITRPWLHVLRAGLGLLAMGASFWTVSMLPLATATSLFFTKPLFMPILAAFFLGEAFRRQRGLATAAGFLGVLVMLDPEGGAMLPVLVGLGGAFCVALVMIVVKKLTATEQPLAVLVWFSLLTSIGIAPLAAWMWVTPSLPQLLMLISLGVVGSLGQYMLIRAYRVGEASAISPTDYTQLLFAGLMGFLFFGELPSLRNWAGIAIIVGATLFLSWHERKAAPPRPSPGDLL